MVVKWSPKSKDTRKILQKIYNKLDWILVKFYDSYYDKVAGWLGYLSQSEQNRVRQNMACQENFNQENVCQFSLSFSFAIFPTEFA